MLLRRYKVNKAREQKPVSEPVTNDDIRQENVYGDEINYKPEYTKTDINRMNKETLIEKATEIGVEDAEELSGNVLKDKLIEYYNL
jgi:hypothetical protein